MSHGRINFKVKTFVDRPGVIRKIGRWKLGQLARVGAYARGAMKKQLRPALRGTKKSRTVVVVPTSAMMPSKWKGPPPPLVVCVVEPNGLVINQRTGRPVAPKIAAEARGLMAARRMIRKGEGEGKPPRSKTGKLKRHIYFAVDVASSSVVVGPEPFPKQPPMRKRVSVPELLNKGGVEVIAGKPVQYGPRPFVETILPAAMKRLRVNIRQKPVSNRI